MPREVEPQNERFASSPHVAADGRLWQQPDEVNLYDRNKEGLPPKYYHDAESQRLARELAGQYGESWDPSGDVSSHLGQLRVTPDWSREADSHEEDPWNPNNHFYAEHAIEMPDKSIKSTVRYVDRSTAEQIAEKHDSDWEQWNPDFHDEHAPGGYQYQAQRPGSRQGHDWLADYGNAEQQPGPGRKDLTADDVLRPGEQAAPGVGNSEYRMPDEYLPTKQRMSGRGK